MIAVVSVPTDDIGRRGVTVGIVGVGVEVSFVPNPNCLRSASGIEDAGSKNDEKEKKEKIDPPAMSRRFHITGKDETSEQVHNHPETIPYSLTNSKSPI